MAKARAPLPANPDGVTRLDASIWALAGPREGALLIGDRKTSAYY